MGDTCVYNGLLDDFNGNAFRELGFIDRNFVVAVIGRDGHAIAQLNGNAFAELAQFRVAECALVLENDDFRHFGFAFLSRTPKRVSLIQTLEQLLAVFIVETCVLRLERIDFACELVESVGLVRFVAKLTVDFQVSSIVFFQLVGDATVDCHFIDGDWMDGFRIGNLNRTRDGGTVVAEDTAESANVPKRLAKFLAVVFLVGIAFLLAVFLAGRVIGVFIFGLVELVNDAFDALVALVNHDVSAENLLDSTTSMTFDGDIGDDAVIVVCVDSRGIAVVGVAIRIAVSAGNESEECVTVAGDVVSRFDFGGF